MSKEMYEKKKQEIEMLEQKEKQAEDIMSKDQCPVCQTPTSAFGYINATLMRTFGLLECTNCGTVFCPASVRKMKEDLKNKSN